MTHHDSTAGRDPEAVATVREIIGDQRICMLTSVHQGALVSRPMAVQDVEFDGDLWFFSQADAAKIDDIASEPHVNVAFSGDDAWLSINGTAQLVRDVEKKKELWNTAASAWLEGGPEDDEVVLLRVQGLTAEYWQGPGRVATVLALVKSAVQRDGRPDVGDNETVRLEGGTHL
ncbi:pyridoxamine 5'-phosphate oxidase family protein [Ornithinimicrobium sediminis]|jgi:general stress protein 26|uniref:pyridoxamine 5'-phosphate oxidase family protein n=1 Tax=Ornithinimicrobium sediminis TaxID=2904603 RepID=UPI001E55C263|nr:pyridoxamine 5'-phosphate oxidase family protein [Ornithinimicrobium sediminis]MCE0487060.1 pyridoxamine 5'-phosphate oxidase family protein [Ornithinimicrobium sediminis]